MPCSGVLFANILITMARSTPHLTHPILFGPLAVSLVDTDRPP